MKLTGLLAVTAVIGLLTTGCTNIQTSGDQAEQGTKDQNQLVSGETVKNDNKDNQEETEHNQQKDDERPQDTKKHERPTLTETIKTTKKGRHIVINPADFLVLVNKERSLPGDYVPEDLVIPDVPFFVKGDDEKKHMRKVPAEALEKLFAAAKKTGMKLYAVSGYRSFDRQQAIFAYNSQRYGEEEANQVSAHAGESEHQTGLTMDISSETFGNQLEQAFGQTAAGKWVAEHAPQYGFIIRYPKGKEEITGYSYEPWHLRYVGKKAASFIVGHNMTLEQYFLPSEQQTERKQ